MNIGIVGSSFSVGSHHNPITKKNDLALPFETWFKKYCPEHQYFNSACSGKGTELYLNKIIFLKERYDIDLLVLELINNRSMINVKTKQKNYEEINYKKLSDIEKNVYENSSSIWGYLRNLDQPLDHKSFSKTNTHYEYWKETQWNIASIPNAMEFWGMLDIYQSLKLCKLLGIKVISWQHSWEFKDFNNFDEIKELSNHIEFGTHPNAKIYYQNKYNYDKSIFCDIAHFTDSINEEMVRDFIVPKIIEVLDK